MTKQKENLLTSNMNMTKEQKDTAYADKIRDLEKIAYTKGYNAKQKKASKKTKTKSDDNIELVKGCNKGVIEKVKQCTAKQEAFARQYLVARCKVAAYRYAYNIENMSEKVIYNKAYEVYNTTYVYDRIMELQEESNKRIEITTDKISQEYAKLAFSILPGIVNYNKGIISLTDFDNLTDSQRSCIKKFEFVTEYKVTEDGKAQPCDRVKIEVYDKKSALDSLAKINGMFIDRSEVKNLGHNMEFTKSDEGLM